MLDDKKYIVNVEFSVFVEEKNYDIRQQINKAVKDIINKELPKKLNEQNLEATVSDKDYINVSMQ